MSNDGVSLTVTGLVGEPHTYDFAALSALPEQVPDVSVLVADREGGAVRLTAVLELAAPSDEARFITLYAEGGYSASVPLDAVLDQAILIYRLDDAPLPADRGGPVRFFIPDVAACQAADVDKCANVKFVERIELSAEQGPDARPRSVAQHVTLHRE